MSDDFFKDGYKPGNGSDSSSEYIPSNGGLNPEEPKDAYVEPKAGYEQPIQQEQSVDINTEKEDALAEELLGENWEKYFSGDQVQSIKTSYSNLNDQWKAVDRLSIHAFTKEDMDQMTEEEKVEYQSKLEKKVKLYDTFQPVLAPIGLDPYKLTINSQIKSAKKLRSGLETALNSYKANLRGNKIEKKGNDQNFYKTLLDNLPNQLQNDQEISGLVGVLQQNSGTGQYEGGTRQKHRALKEELLYLADMHDLLTVHLTKYDSGMGEVKGKLREVNRQKINDKNNSNLINKGAKLSAVMSAFDKEREKVSDRREEVVQRIIDARSDYGFLGQQIALQETAVKNTRNSLRKLNVGIKNLELYQQEKDGAANYANLLRQTSLANKTSKGLNAMGSMGRTVAGAQTRGIIEDSMHDEGIVITNSQDFDDLKSQLDSQDDELIANLKKEIRDDFYS